MRSAPGCRSWPSTTTRTTRANAPLAKLSGLPRTWRRSPGTNPALVIASENSGGLVSGLGELGVPVLIESAATLNHAYDQSVEIGQATGQAQQSDRTVVATKGEFAANVKQADVSHKGLT